MENKNQEVDNRTPEELMSDVLKKVDGVLQENGMLKVQLKKVMEEQQQNSQAAMFGQNIFNTITEKTVEEGKNNGQWVTQRVIIQAKIRMEGNQVQMGDVQVMKDSLIKPAPTLRV